VRSGDQVKNHLKTRQKKFCKICDLGGLSVANWDEDTYTITLDDEHYNDNIKV
jgi:3-hydroxy-3-methylglutaryl CoA synthase